MKIALVTDSTANLSAAEIEKYNIKVIPIPIYIDDKEYLEGINITSEELLNLAEWLQLPDHFPAEDGGPHRLLTTSRMRVTRRSSTFASQRDFRFLQH